MPIDRQWDYQAKAFLAPIATTGKLGRLICHVWTDRVPKRALSRASRDTLW